MDDTQGYTAVAEDGGKLYVAFIAVTGPTFVEATPVSGGFSVQIPAGFKGQTYAVLTGCDTSVTDDTVAAGPALIEVSNSRLRRPERKEVLTLWKDFLNDARSLDLAFH